ncbi:DUF1353 domain-containing protein [Shewanella eurypsychrophilus]|uniref:DUF1353 domain-containing protein n=1 Tax=Shewanella eurypsychrophilus TaxID=2593656 RepID=A0ABX6V9D3_9GAMM|nr:MULTISPECIES: DUF1353 domain-containing protein [Shewanella]QFU23749.1 DUF1353 domain-containing protein [Shewanella sp. YLB-09]QPG58972.1 DUF1353 domain-containing protein [Shewanella eurypsychrophilus]
MSQKLTKPHFIGRVVTHWLAKEPRKMLLEEPFSFVDKDGIKWTAPAGSIIDGASIPRPLWYLIGSPFNGRYRRSSVIHDVYCVTQSRPHKQVHRMFYDAIRADGVSKVKALAMYGALKIGAPRWTFPKEKPPTKNRRYR